ncbi:MAG: NADH-quinone oxidoreductase subunit [Actinomycetota bacterium]|jgi:NADH-quinone oxidoreductase subunit J
MMELVVFVCAAGMVLAGALGVLFTKHPVHAALSLILTLFGIAVLFVALEANFLAAVQVIVYAGAIVVLFLFVIMLLGVDKVEAMGIDPIRLQRPIAAIVGLSTAGLVTVAILASRESLTAQSGSGLSTDPADADGNIRLLARDVFSDKVLAFELTSVLLVIAVVGTVLLARKPRKGETEVTP